MVKTIDAATFVQMLGEGVRNLDANRQLVNDLNVFPIPDGDTGDNMLSTISSGFEAASCADNSSLDSVAASAAEGMLLGARGNSGVILSRIFAGIAAGFSGTVSAGTREFGEALGCGVREAYKAVSVPVEGTMLTVIREAVEKANSASGGNISLEEYFEIFRKELKESLERTPELLSVLKEAGVVDSGGAGLMYIVEGMVKVLRGEAGENVVPASAGAPSGKQADLSKFTEDSELEFGYCTEFLLRLQRSKTDLDTFDVSALSDYLNGCGESVVCFREGSIVKVHVHTMHPGDVLNYFQKYGEFLTLKIENMTLQHNENTPGKEKAYGHSGESVEGDETVTLKTKPHKKFATVAVGSGEGIKNTFLSLGVDAVVDGGQSMNPSAGDFIEAFRSIDADCILVFPNNGNIILTANQAAALYEKADVRVVATGTIGAGYSALSMLDVSSGDPDQIVAQAEEIGKAAVTAHVAIASRTTEMNGVEVRKDDYIGFTDDKVFVDDPDREEAAFRLAVSLGAGGYDVVLVISGNGIPAEKATALAERLEKEFKRTEFIYIEGGQPVYDYIMIFE